DDGHRDLFRSSAQVECVVAGRAAGDDDVGRAVDGGGRLDLAVRRSRRARVRRLGAPGQVAIDVGDLGRGRADTAGFAGAGRAVCVRLACGACVRRRVAGAVRWGAVVFREALDARTGWAAELLGRVVGRAFRRRAVAAWRAGRAAPGARADRGG